MENGGNAHTAGGARQREISKRCKRGVKMDRKAKKEREREKELRSYCSAAFGVLTG